MMREVIVATGNAGKMKEISEIFADCAIKLLSLRDVFAQIPYIAETGSTFLENARIKAQWVFSATGRAALADDSGLEVDALGGEPGVYSARYAGENAGDAGNNQKLLCRLQAIEMARRTARFRCAVVLCAGSVEYAAQGCCEGKIGFEPAGDGGFGYDPLFYPSGCSMTFAQLDVESKHAISHRGRALRALKEKMYDWL